MNLLFGEIADVFIDNGLRMGKIRVGGAMKNASLEFVTNAACGDTVLLCDGVAISKVEPSTETIHVPCDSR